MPVLLLTMLEMALLSFLQTAHLHKEIQWVTQSIEYAALCKQTYNMAWVAVKAAALNERKPWVVVFDIDETVLDNSAYQAQRAAIDSGFTQASWQAWVWQKEAVPVPGAKAMLDSIRSLTGNGHIAFLSNRSTANDSATILNMKKYDLYRDGDILLTRRDREDSKMKRRQELISGTGRCRTSGALLIIALFGDNIRDFLEIRGSAQAEDYQKRLPEDDRWGKLFFMLPNPIYGSWERLYD